MNFQNYLSSNWIFKKTSLQCKRTMFPCLIRNVWLDLMLCLFICLNNEIIVSPTVQYIFCDLSKCCSLFCTQLTHVSLTIKLLKSEDFPQNSVSNVGQNNSRVTSLFKSFCANITLIYSMLQNHFCRILLTLCKPVVKVQNTVVNTYYIHKCIIIIKQ